MDRRGETLRLIEWIGRNEDDWFTICGMGKHPISEEEYLRIQENLIRDDFELLTLVLLTCHEYAISDSFWKAAEMLNQAYQEEMRRRATM